MILSFIFSIYWKIDKFITKLICDNEGHQITWTCSNGMSGCKCGSRIIK